MNSFARQILFRSRYVPAALAGLLLVAAFPKFDVAGFAWIAPGLILACAYRKTGADAFRIGYIAGLAFFLGTLSWLLEIPVTGFPILGWLAMSAFLGLFPAVWVWLLAGKVAEGSWLRRTTWALLGAAIWVALEMIRARIFSGFPWNNLGASQLKLLPLVQLASVTGVYGISFLIAWTSLTLHTAVVAIFRHPTTRYIWLSEMILPMFALLAAFGWGMHRIRQLPPETDFIRVSMVQPSIPQTMIWNTTDSEHRFQELMRLTEQVLTAASAEAQATNTTSGNGVASPTPHLLLWPEAAVPKMIRYDEPTLQAITEMARKYKVWMLLGSDDTEPRSPTDRANNPKYFNASFLVNPEGELIARYVKRHLVMFGEYIPLTRWLPFIKWFTPIDSGFDAGDKVEIFQLDRAVSNSANGATPNEKVSNASVRFAPLICFEDTFPHLVREYVDENLDFLVNITNDGWFGQSAAQWQHATAAAFRAVENGLPLVRCCNNGLTCWIDSRGRIREIFRDAQGSEYGVGVATFEIPTLSLGELREPTPYRRHGDRFGWTCVALFAGVCLVRVSRIIRYRRKAASSET